MFPLYDENPTRSKPIVTWSLILINVIVFIWQISSGLYYEIMVDYGEIPFFVTNGERLFTLITSMFLHGDILHIFGNMLYLFVFGDNVEDRFGHTKFLFLYLIFGIVGGLAHSYVTIMFNGADALIPAIGASGAISGLLGAYIMFFPRARIVSVAIVYYLIRIIKVPASIFIGFWFILQFLYVLLGSLGGVAYWAHIGGFFAGFIVASIAKSLT
jgi:membrane associated rhomboid family serine protease